jgi:phospholipid/cholesterol/gamma-HCH transport system permease protein
MDLSNQESANPPKVSLSRSDPQTVLLEFSGDWKLDLDPPPAGKIQEQMEASGQCRRIAFDSSKLAGWDSSLLSFLTKVYDYCSRKSIEKIEDGLPRGLVRLLALATAVPEQKEAHRDQARTSFLFKVGDETIKLGYSAKEIFAFIGEASLSFLKIIRGKARFRKSDLTLLLQDCGASALPIVSLISVLVGLILAFVGAVQLRLFGAQIFVADLVGLGMAREMGAMMTAVIMAGRTGAAFAAQLGTMQVNEEIDALQTMGISPMEFLVMPRMLALAIMMPLLCLYADLMGMLGGGIVGIGMLHLSPAEYYHETLAALRLMDFGAGLIKGVVFGVLVALSGCLRGIQCGRSASAVGDATTSAVVTSIVLIIVSDSILTVIYDILGI